MTHPLALTAGAFTAALAYLIAQLTSSLIAGQLSAMRFVRRLT